MSFIEEFASWEFIYFAKSRVGLLQKLLFSYSFCTIVVNYGLSMSYIYTADK